MDNRHPWERRLLSLYGHLIQTQPLPSSCTMIHPNHMISKAITRLDSEIVLGSPVIIGGMVLDIHAKPFTCFKSGTTTPGKVEYVKGGVARNVAECMAVLGLKSFIISVLGHDMAGDMLLKHWSALGLVTDGIMITQDAATPVVLNVFDSDGELASAVASVEAVEKCLSNFWIEQFKSKIQSAPIVMVDANLNPQLLKYACLTAAEHGIPIWFEPVSIVKSERVASIAKYITFVSPNEHELIAMANAVSSESGLYLYNMKDTNEERLSPEAKAKLLKPAICLLLNEGIKVVVVTLGSEGMLLCSREDPNFMKLSLGNIVSSKSDSQLQLFELVNSSCLLPRIISSTKSIDRDCAYVVHLPALPASVLSLTGAGDCFVGGALASICSGLDLVKSMAVAISVAKAAVENKLNVPSELSLRNIADEAKQVCSAAQLFILG